MIQHPVARTCLACGRALKGRSDKKFCDDTCRNVYNNDLKGSNNNYIRAINNALRRNRRILEECLGNGEQTGRATKDKLLQKGFLFQYITHSYVNKKGNTYLFCYDLGYLELDGDAFLVVRRKG